MFKEPDASIASPLTTCIGADDIASAERIREPVTCTRSIFSSSSSSAAIP